MSAKKEKYYMGVVNKINSLVDDIGTRNFALIIDRKTDLVAGCIICDLEIMKKMEDGSIFSEYLVEVFEKEIEQ